MWVRNVIEKYRNKENYLVAKIKALRRFTLNERRKR